MAIFACETMELCQMDILARMICDNGLAREAQNSSRVSLGSAEHFAADLVFSDGLGFELWLGSLEDALCLESLRREGITGVLNCATSECVGECAVYRNRGFSRRRTHARGLSLLEQGFAPSAGAIEDGRKNLDRDQVRALAEFDSEWYSDMLGVDVAYCAISAEDKDGYAIDQHFDEMLDFLRKCQSERRKVLVHCVMGINRSATALVAYLCQELGMSLGQAVDLASKRRGHILSNVSFLRCLVEHFSQVGVDVCSEGSSPLLRTRLSGSCPDMQQIALGGSGASWRDRAQTHACVLVC